jgi:hypothetical protein
MTLKLLLHHNQKKKKKIGEMKKTGEMKKWNLGALLVLKRSE